MKILLVGEFSNVHNNLAQGLRAIGHSVIVASNGNHWLGYSRDIDLMRVIEKGDGFFVKIRNLFHLAVFLVKLVCALPHMRGYDIVQLINPDFLDLKAERLFWVYRYLCRHNNKIILGVYGTDYYYADSMINQKPLRYSPYNGGDEKEQKDNIELRSKEWFGSAKEKLCREIAYSCDAIVACCYEYWLPYKHSMDKDDRGEFLNEKLYFVPLPIVISPAIATKDDDKRLKVFIGINRIRASFKGASIMVRALYDLEAKYPDRIKLYKVENVPYKVYREMMASSDVVIDQIYSYSPGMNALLAMSKGKIVISGGEPECYELLGEKECKPIVNVEPTYDSVYNKVERLVLHPELIADLKRQSREFVRRNHDYVTVAKRMAEIYEKCLSSLPSSPPSY